MFYVLCVLCFYAQGGEIFRNAMILAKIKKNIFEKQIL